jgi:hypothetical protein
MSSFWRPLTASTGKETQVAAGLIPDAREGVGGASEPAFCRPGRLTSDTDARTFAGAASCAGAWPAGVGIDVVDDGASGKTGR